MSKRWMVMMVCWAIVVPAIVTILRLGIDYIVGNNMEWLSYSAVFLGTAAEGLIFTGPQFHELF
ncbi:hypothetical protein [Salibacterium sp. K-3]